MTIETGREKGLAWWTEGWRRKGLEGNISKDSRELEGRLRWYEEKGTASTMGRERSYRSQLEMASFPKRPMKFHIILSKSMPTKMEVDRAGGTGVQPKREPGRRVSQPSCYFSNKEA